MFPVEIWFFISCFYFFPNLETMGIHTIVALHFKDSKKLTHSFHSNQYGICIASVWWRPDIFLMRFSIGVVSHCVHPTYFLLRETHCLSKKHLILFFDLFTWLTVTDACFVEQLWSVTVLCRACVVWRRKGEFYIWCLGLFHMKLNDSSPAAIIALSDFNKKLDIISA